MERLAQDLRFGLRLVSKRPGFAVAAVLTLALGIGANVAVFNLAMASLFPRLPVQDADRLAALYQYGSFGGDGPAYYSSFSLPTYRDYKERLRSFSGVAAYQTLPMNLSLDGRAERVEGAVVSSDYFDLLGLRAAIGRGFLPEEGRGPDARAVAVVSHALWRSQFGGDTAVVGRALWINGHRFEIVGVAPAAYRGLGLDSETDVWVPLSMSARAVPYLGEDHRQRRGGHWLELLGRLRPGVELSQASAEVEALARALADLYPEGQAGWTARVMPASQATVWPGRRGDLADRAVILAAVVGLILLLACANVTNMILGRVAGRRQEIAVRVALGAGRRRLVRQLLVEGLVLTLPAGAIALLASLWIGGLLGRFQLHPVLPAGFDPALDLRAVGLLLALMLVIVVVLGLIPTLQAARGDLVARLRSARSGSSGGAGGARLRRALSVIQVAGSLAVLVCGGLLVRSAVNQLRVDLGFEPEGVVMLAVDPGLSGYSRERGHEFYRSALDRLEALPGVASASLAGYVPLARWRFATSVVVGGDADRGLGSRQVTGNVVAPGYFETMGIPVHRGRDFSWDDARLAVIVSRSTAAAFWPAQDPLGKRLELPGTGGGAVARVVGVVADAVQGRSLGGGAEPIIYLPISGYYVTPATFHVRVADSDPATVVPAVRSALSAVEPDLPVYDIRRLNDHVRAALRPALASATYVAVLGLVGLLLAGVGIYAVIANAVVQRTHELGLRIALGAKPSGVLRFVLGDGLRLTAVGVAIGLPVGFALTNLLSWSLYGVSPSDPAAYFVATMLTVLVALAAMYIPARRAARLDPLTALRVE